MKIHTETFLADSDTPFQLVKTWGSMEMRDRRLGNEGEEVEER